MVVYDVTTRRTIALQPPASTLLKALLQGRDDAAAAIGPEDLESGSCADVEAAIVDLENAGLITVHDD